MKRLALSAVLLAVVLAPSLEGSAPKCLRKEDVCVGISCDFLARLKFAQAAVRVYAKFVHTPPTQKQSADAVDDLYKVNKEYDKCLGSSFEDDVPLPDVKPPACVVGMKNASGNVQPATLDDLLKASEACSESVEAEYRRALVIQGQCLANVKSGRPVSPARQQVEKLTAAQERLDALKESLSSYLNSCAPDGPEARELSTMKLDALMKESKATRDKWLAARFGVQVR
jgi:hypothetical protein